MVRYISYDLRLQSYPYPRSQEPYTVEKCVLQFFKTNDHVYECSPKADQASNSTSVIYMLGPKAFLIFQYCFTTTRPTSISRQVRCKPSKISMLMHASYRRAKHACYILLSVPLRTVLVLALHLVL